MAEAPKSFLKRDLEQVYHQKSQLMFLYTVLQVNLNGK